MAEETKARVLLVDDEDDVRTTLEKMLRHVGYDVTPAASSEEALALATQQAFDVLVTDVYMTGVPGDQLAVEIQKLQPDILPVIITAYPDMDLAIRSMNQGVRRFLTKPVPIDSLREALAEVLAQRQQEMARARRGLVEALLEQHEEAGEKFDLAAALHMATGEATVSPDRRRDTRILVLCEDLDVDAAQLRTAERFRHFRTLNRAQKAFNGQLQRAGSTASVRLAVVSRAADLHRCLQVHGERVHSIILGPNFHRQSADLIRLLAISRTQRTVVCHDPGVADFSWGEFRRMTASLPVVGYRASASHEDTVAFWADYFTHQVRVDMRDPAPETPAVVTGNSLSVARRAYNLDPVGVDLLPAFPDICQRVADAIDAGAGFEHIAEIASLDGPLLTTLVHRSNAAAYGSRRIESATAALAAIGTAEMRKLLLGRAMAQIVRRVQQAGFSNRDFFLHSATVGFIAQLLSVDPDDRSDASGNVLPAGLPPYVADLLRSFGLWKHLACPPGHDAFTAGMLHDIGKVALVSGYPDAFPQIIHELQQRQWLQGSRGAERVVTGDLSHSGLGAALLENWGVFPQHVTAICDHHQISADTPGPTALIALANCLAKGVHPFPLHARMPQPERQQFLGLPGLDTYEYANPLLAAQQELQGAFDRQRSETELGDDVVLDSERYRPETATALMELARQTVRADDRQYLSTLLNQNPEFISVAARCGAPGDDLLALSLLLQEPIRMFVADLLRLTTSADPIVRRAMAG
jgi:FixJ family two-component response regulator/HD-like signal output (HDOD) protein